MGVGMEDLMEKVEQWAEGKGIDKAESWKPQFKKIAEEVKEYRDELRKYEDSKGDHVYLVNDEMTEMGDILVTLIVMAQQRGYELYDCLEMAYEKIKNRKGEVIDGTFVKAEDIGKLECSLGG